MSFDTLTFWIFFGVAWTAWRRLPFGAAKTAALLLSLVFYAWWDPFYVVLILFSASLDYVAGPRIHAAPSTAARRAWLAVSLAGNLGLLGYFKYGRFVTESLRDILGVDLHVDWSGWVLPVGISFYTFQSLSYSIDIYRGQIAPHRGYRDFLLFVSFFPQLVAGPIVRARELLPQLRRRRRLTSPAVQRGLYHIITGLFLKVVVADNLAPVSERILDTSLLPDISPLDTWLAVAYGHVRFFADFAGYSEIAIGLAFTMGLRFPENFRTPFISRSITEFWRRWHITLLRWLRDYVYIPLGGDRHGRRRLYLAILVTTLVSGLWHGASWTFVCWGALQGVGVSVERLLVRRQGRPVAGPPVGLSGVLLAGARIGLVLFFMLNTFVLFMASDFETVGMMFARLYAPLSGEAFGLEDLAHARHLLLLLPVIGIHLAQLGHEWYGLRKTAVRRALVAALWLFLLTVFSREAPTDFVYFRF